METTGDTQRSERSSWSFKKTLWLSKSSQESSRLFYSDSGVTRLTAVGGASHILDPDPELTWNTFCEFLAALACFLLHPHGSTNFALQVYFRGGAYAGMCVACAVLLGGPLLLYEAALGQCTMAHPIDAFRFCPILQGLGFGMMLCVLMMLVFETLSLGAGCFFAVISLTIPYSTDLVNSTVYDRRIPGDVGVSGSYYLYHVFVGSQHYFHGTGPGVFREYLLFGLLFSWILLFVGSITNSVSFSQVVFIGVLLPLECLMFWIMTSALQYDGATKALYEVFKISTIPDFEMAVMAFMHTVVSLGSSCGMIIYMGSQAGFHWPRSSWWAYLMALAVMAKELLFAAMMAAALGANAASRNTTIHSLVHMEMMGLALKVLYVGLEYVSFDDLWRVFVFVMYWLAELYYALLLLRFLVAGARSLPFLRQFSRARVIITAVICIGLLGFGIFCCFRNTAGYAMFGDLQQPKWEFSVLCLMEVIAGVYCYGVTDLLLAFKEGMGYFPDLYTRVCWLLLPVVGVITTLVSLEVAYDRREDMSRMMCARVDCISGVFVMIVVMVPIVIIGLNNIRIHTLQGTLVSLLRPQRDTPDAVVPSRRATGKTSGNFMSLQDLAKYLRGTNQPTG